MGHSVKKQAIPVEFFEQIRTEQPLLTLIDHLWGFGKGMFDWFTPPPVTSFGYLPSPMDSFKQNYKATQGSWGNIFESENEFESYCTLLEHYLEQLKTDDPALVHRKVYFDRRTDEQIYSFLTKELEVKFPALDFQFSYRAIWGGEQIKSDSDLLYLVAHQVSEIAHVLDQIEVNELLCHFNASEYDPNYWLEVCRKTIQVFQTCFEEAAERGQVILTKII